MALFKKLKALFQKKKPIKETAPKPKPEIKKPTKQLPVKKKILGDAYRVLKEPHISEKATVLADQNKYIFKVYPEANKIETKKAIENLYGVKVKDVNIINVHRKRRTFQGIEGFKSGYKKAIVTLEEGQKIEIIPR